jgi:3-oxoadipate enol-lactonase
MAEIIIGGEPFNVILEGEANGPTVVLSHGLGTNLHLFDAQVPALKRHFRVLRYDTRGSGRSVVSRGPYSISQLGHDALAILDAVKLEKVNWIGHSEGGMVGLWLLTQAPERIDRAILANTAAQIGGAEAWNERIRTVHEKGLKGLAASVLENWFTRQFRERHPDEVRRFEDALLATSPEGYAASCAAIRDADLRAGLRGIGHSVLVIGGRHDPVTPPGVGALIASSINSAKLVTLEAAHLSPVEAAEAFNRAAIDFLTGKGERPADMKPDETKPPEPPHADPSKPLQPRPAQPPVHSQPGAPAPGMPRPMMPAAPPRPAMPATPPRPTIPVAPPRPSIPSMPPRPAIPAAPPKPAPGPAAAHPTPPKPPAKKAAVKKRKAKKAVAKKHAVRKTAKKHTVKKAAKRGAGKKAARKPARKTAKKTTRKSARKPAKKSARRSRSRKR